MREYTAEQLMNVIRKDAAINFIAFAISPWAAHGVDAYISRCYDEQEKIKGFICVLEHSRSGYLLDESHFSNTDDNIQIVRVKGGKCENDREILLKGILKKNMKKEASKFYILSQRVPSYLWHFRIKSVRDSMYIKSIVIDEGLGMYMRNDRDWFNEFVGISSSIQKKINAAFNVYIYNHLLDMILEKKKEKEYFTLLNKKNNNLEINPIAVRYYKLAIEKIGKSSKEDSIYEDAVVLLTQPYYEMGSIANDEDLKILEQVCNVCARAHLKVVLKPHPRETDIERYNILKNCYVDIKKGKSVESIISGLKRKPKAIIGFSSTSLVAEKLFDEIKTVSLIDCMNDCNVVGAAKVDFDKFRQIFGTFVEFPSEIKSI